MSDVEWFEQSVMQMKIFTDRQRQAARFLESKGRRFLIHFGVDNCESLAEQLGWEPILDGPIYSLRR